MSTAATQATKQMGPYRGIWGIAAALTLLADLTILRRMVEQLDLSGIAVEDRDRTRKEIEEEIRTLGQRVAFVLHPDQVVLEPTATLVFGPMREEADRPADPEVVERYGKALEQARTAPEYWTDGHGPYLRHHARFKMADADKLFDLYCLTCDLPGNEVLIYDLPLPYSRDLWLPLFWFHRR